MSKRYRYLFTWPFGDKLQNSPHKSALYRIGPTLIVFVLIVLSAGLLFYALRDNKPTIGQYSSVPRPARIRPDYCDTVIPPNIAPLNFIVQEEGSHYCVKIYSKKGRTIEVFSQSPKIVIPQKPWHRLLDLNKTEELYFDIYQR